MRRPFATMIIFELVLITSENFMRESFMCGDSLYIKILLGVVNLSAFGAGYCFARWWS